MVLPFSLYSYWLMDPLFFDLVKGFIYTNIQAIFQ